MDFWHLTQKRLKSILMEKIVTLIDFESISVFTRPIHAKIVLVSAVHYKSCG